MESQCTACGERNPAGSAFCVFCGSYLGWNEADDGQAVREQPALPAGVPPADPLVGRPAAAPGHPQPAPPPDPSATTTATGTPCPQCGQVNPANRRFCSRCGQQLVAATAGTDTGSSPSSRPPSWRSQRRAKRDYRRSLPGFYRFRRLALGLLAVAVVALLVPVLNHDPIGWVRARWYDLRDTTEPVAGVGAVAKVPGADGTIPMEDVVDDDPATVWSRTWIPGTPAANACSAAESQGYVELRWETPVRVRVLQVDPGLAEDDNGRDLQFRPATILVRYRSAAGKPVCRVAEVPDTAERTDIDVDTGGEVNRLRISVGSVFDSKTPREDGPVSIRRLIVRARPG